MTNIALSPSARAEARAALARLKAGNLRFLERENSSPTLEIELVQQQAKAQEPYATILGCSDCCLLSKTQPEPA